MPFVPATAAGCCEEINELLPSVTDKHLQTHRIGDRLSDFRHAVGRTTAVMAEGSLE
jgi:hypothetical protein